MSDFPDSAAYWHDVKAHFDGRRLREPKPIHLRAEGGPPGLDTSLCGVSFPIGRGRTTTKPYAVTCRACAKLDPGIDKAREETQALREQQAAEAEAKADAQRKATLRAAPRPTMPPIPADDLPRMRGHLVHLAWAAAGCVWRLVRVHEGGSCLLETPKTRKLRAARTSDLRYTDREWRLSPGGRAEVRAAKAATAAEGKDIEP